MNKNQLIIHLREILNGDLDDILQGDYDDRNDILSMFEHIIDRIQNHVCTNNKQKKNNG